MTTHEGGIISILVRTIVLLFAAQKLSQLLRRTNPDVSAVLFREEFSDKEIFDINAEGFRLAFTVENYNTNENKVDPRYLKWFVQHTYVIDGVSTAREIPYHKCTAEDMAQFHPGSEQSADLLQRLVTDPKRGGYCIDWKGSDVHLQANE